MEAVKVKKPKPKPRVAIPQDGFEQERAERTERTPIREAPPLPPRGNSIAQVPEQTPSSSRLAASIVRSRSVSPEPEEIDFTATQTNNVQSQSSTAPPIPTHRLIFPKTDAVSAEKPPIDFEERTTVRNAAAYPAVPSLTAGLMTDLTLNPPPPSYAQLMQEARSSQVPQIVPPAAHVSQVMPKVAQIDAPPLYPGVSKMIFERNRHGLLSEQHLLTYYHNPLYEVADEMTTRFIQDEELPSGPLFPLLARLKDLSERAILGEVAEKENSEALQKCLRECWTLNEKPITFQGRCGEDREGTGNGSYQSATLSGEKVAEMRRLLTKNRNVLLNQRLNHEVEFRSLALQIQWKVLSINNQFMAEHNVGQQSPVSLHSNMLPNGSSRLIRCALSDLFFHLRFPSLPQRFIGAVTAWITEISSALFKRCSSEDAQFILLHLLRLPSPISDWATPLVQTFAGTTAPNKLKIDHCMTMLGHLMAPIRARESFLRQVGQSEGEEESWAILGDDDGDDPEFSFVTINEQDLISFLDQLPVADFYSLAFLHFTSETNESSAQFVSLISFQLLLMKLLNEGLNEYGKPSNKLFCKQIGMYLRQSVRELCNLWRTTQSLLPPAEYDQLQLEIDRILILAVQYIISHQNLGLYQFLVDLPYEFVSEECRQRVIFLLRSPQPITAKELYEIPTEELPAKIEKCQLKYRIYNPEEMDSVFMINSLATIASVSSGDPTKFIKEILELCFCEESTRDQLYKVGGEALAQMILRKPKLLDQILTTLDRLIDHMGNYAVDTLASCDLSQCGVSQAILGSVLGKWLINRGADHVANRLARRVLSSLNWGYDSSGQLWMDAGVHEMCASTVVKAHAAHCGKSNGLIAKSIQKVAKLASKIADHEAHFNQFVWDILIKLKLTVELSTVVPQQDLAAFYVHTAKHAIAKPEIFLDKGVQLMNELVNSGCTIASAILFGRVVQQHHKAIGSLVADNNFIDMAERVLHADQCSYAVQLLTGPSSTPTPIVRLIRAQILVFSQNMHDKGAFLNAWAEILLAQRTYIWNTDQVALQILGTIVQIAFSNDSIGLLGLSGKFAEAYLTLQSSSKEQSRGLFSLFSGDSSPPSLLLAAYYPISPWATYFLLLIEQEAFQSFYTYLWETFAKKDKNNGDQAVKKAAQKSGIALTPDRLPAMRWANAIAVCRDSEILPLIVQQFGATLFKRRSTLGKSYVFAQRIVSTPSCAQIFADCRNVLESKAHPKGFYKAVSGWVFSNRDLNVPNFNFSCFDLDYLLQMLLSGDASPWMDFVNLAHIHQSSLDEIKLYQAICHEERRMAARNGWEGPSERDRAVRALPFPTLPTHPGLPTPPRIDYSMIQSQDVLMSLFAPMIRNVNKLSDNFVSVSDDLAENDQRYCELISRLYLPVQRSITVIVQCSSRCPRPSSATVQVTATEFSAQCDAEMTQNRERRGTSITSAQASLLDAAAMQTASMEFVALQVAVFASMMDGAQRVKAQGTGRSLFYLTTSSISSEVMLFPAATSSFENVLRVLGKEFVRLRPEEQMNVMRLVLDGFVLSDPLVEVFTPECLGSQELCDCYAKLSESVGHLEKSQRAFKLLGRLAIDKTTSSLPAQQFMALIPIAFNNVASQPDPSTELHELCLKHLVTFIFHKFPLNFVYGLDVALAGCNTGAAPASLFEIFVEKLNGEKWEAPKGQFVINGIKSLECCVVITKRLSEGRALLGANLFAVWAKYLDPITRLAQLFLQTAVRESFDASAPQSVSNAALVDAFSRVISLFSPLIVPPSSSVPPFSPSHAKETDLCVERMVQLINALPYNTTLAPGQQNAQSLVWQFFCEKLSRLTHGTAHYYATLETHLMRIHWPSFWPSLRALTAMNEIFASRSADCFPVVAQIFVRIAWMDVISKSIPVEIRASYMSTLLFITTRLVSRQQTYAKIRASLCELLKQFGSLNEWKSIAVDDCQKIANCLSESFPSDALTNSSDVLSLFFSLWRNVCYFSVQDSSVNAEILLKQQAYIKAELRLILRGNTANALVHYVALIADCNSIAKAYRSSDLRNFSLVTRELTAVWAQISDVKMGETLVNGFMTYLSTNASSPLVLLTVHRVIDSLSNDQLSTALKVMEKAIRAYFQKPDAEWVELFEWCAFPEVKVPAIFHYLLTVPNSENKATPLLLTLRSLLDHGLHSDEIFLRTIVYLEKLKPKYIDDEVAVLVLLRRLMQWLVRWFSGGQTQSAMALNEPLQSLQRWLERSKIEEKQGLLSGIIGSKKNQYSNKFRAIIALLELFIKQQTNAPDRPPRMSQREPIMNSRISAVGEMAALKTNQQLSSLFNTATGYFASTDYTFKDSPALFEALMRMAYQDRVVQG
ncbi:unnamed protein product, partial [Mesorhabditis belari]|uniref:Uncharacterized protein n=1 Tax=Mesorhabditis belari TaxID=2138241 RepID=A0AAF3EUD6_9BILA